ncbi:MAG: hypothetical protein AABY42_06890 [Nitrospirota bacterium]
MEEMILIGLDLSMASSDTIEILISDENVEIELFREIIDSNKKRPEILLLLAEGLYVPDDIREEAGRLVNAGLAQRQPEKRDKAYNKESLLQKLQRLTVGEKILLALRGGRDIRSILLRESNKEVALSVLKNPKITETEVENIAHSRQVTEDALRVISKNREWMKSYTVMLALVSNPKTPPGIGSGLVVNLKKKDLTLLVKNKNVSEAVRINAKKLLDIKGQG